ncbi:MAG TPA: hypothetical protein DEA08_28040, partial [Planctomycetes bacterium]|nr:hypothetical protein [Planctomycetota bacterium]
ETPMTAIKPSFPVPAPAERSDVRVTANRCPFCHEDVQLETSEWVACRSCQARHHRDCWSESGACGSCGTEVFLAVPALEATRSGPPTSLSVVGWAWVILGGFTVLSGGGALLAWSVISPTPGGEVAFAEKIFPFLSTLQVGGGALGAVSGYQLLRLRAWARTVLEALTWPILLALLAFPLAAAYGTVRESGIAGPELVGVLAICVANAAIFGIPTALMLRALRSDGLREALREQEA